jgi:hypothetical protein
LDDLFDYGIVEEEDRKAIFYANHPSIEPSGSSVDSMMTDLSLFQLSLNICCGLILILLLLLITNRCIGL